MPEAKEIVYSDYQQKHKNNSGVLENTLGLILLAVFFLAAIGTAGSNVRDSLGNMTFCLPISLAVLLSWRAGSIDLSVWGVASLPSIFLFLSGSPILSLGLGILSAAVIGLINGIIIRTRRLPAGLLLLTSGCFIYGLYILTMRISDYKKYSDGIEEGYVLFVTKEPIFIVVSFLSALGVFFLIYFTKLGIRFDDRKDEDKRSLSMIWAYSISASLAALAGGMYDNQSAIYSYNIIESILCMMVLCGVVLISSSLYDGRKWAIPIVLVLSLACSLLPGLVAQEIASSIVALLFLVLLGLRNVLRVSSYTKCEAGGESLKTGPDEHPKNHASAGYAILGLFIPIVGLVLYLVWKDEKPGDARAAGIGAIVGVCANLFLVILIEMLPFLLARFI